MSKLIVGKRYLVRAHAGEAEILDGVIDELSPTGKYAHVAFSGWVEVAQAVVLEELKPAKGADKEAEPKTLPVKVKAVEKPKGTTSPRPSPPAEGGEGEAPTSEGAAGTDGENQTARTE